MRCVAGGIQPISGQQRCISGHVGRVQRAATACVWPSVMQVAGKDPSTMSCDRLTVNDALLRFLISVALAIVLAPHPLLLPPHQVSVVMPGTVFKDVALDVQGDQFLVRAPHYKLALQLQHTVDDKQASARRISSQLVTQLQQ